MSVGPPSRSFAAASVQTTSLVNPTSLLRTPLLRLWGVHETLTKLSLFTGSSRLANSLSGSLVFWSTFSQFRSCIGSDYFSRLSLSTSISHLVSVYASSCDLLLFFLSQRPTSISTPPCVSTAGLSTLSLQRQLGRCLGRCRPLLGGSSVLSSVLFILYATPPRGSTQRVLFDWGPI